MRPASITTWRECSGTFAPGRRLRSANMSAGPLDALLKTSMIRRNLVKRGTPVEARRPWTGNSRAFLASLSSTPRLSHVSTCLFLEARVAPQFHCSSSGLPQSAWQPIKKQVVRLRNTVRRRGQSGLRPKARLPGRQRPGRPVIDVRPIRADDRCLPAGSKLCSCFEASETPPQVIIS